MFNVLSILNGRKVVAAAVIGYPCGLETPAEFYWETSLFNR